MNRPLTTTKTIANVVYFQIRFSWFIGRLITQFNYNINWQYICGHFEIYLQKKSAINSSISSVHIWIPPRALSMISIHKSQLWARASRRRYLEREHFGANLSPVMCATITALSDVRSPKSSRISLVAQLCVQPNAGQHSADCVTNETIDHFRRNRRAIHSASLSHCRPSLVVVRRLTATIT